MLTRIVAVLWTCLCVWVCGEAIYVYDPSGDPAVFVDPKLGESGGATTTMMMIPIWIGGLGAIVVVRSIFRGILGKSVPPAVAPPERVCACGASVAAGFNHCPQCGAGLG